MSSKVATRTVGKITRAGATVPAQGLMEDVLGAGLHSSAAADAFASAPQRRRTGMLKSRLDALREVLAAPTKAPRDSSASAKPPCTPPSEAFPSTRLLDPSRDAARDLRLPREMEILGRRRQLEGLQGELRTKEGDANEVLDGIRHLELELEVLDAALVRDFIPKHSQRQLISPRNFFCDRLFHVKSRSAPRAPHLEFQLDARSANGPRYVGPELRQGDGLVFMALLNLCRDYRVGKQACFDVASMTQALWGAYNGRLRTLLKQTIQRLQRATIEFSGLTVQLVQRFEHPQHGEWSVALDRDIVELFRDQPETWLDLHLWKRLPEGLTTWLYAYVRSQGRMIPWRIDDLRSRCGSEANDKTFREMLGKSLMHLCEEGVIDKGWSLKGQLVRWRKLKRPGTSAEQVDSAGGDDTQTQPEFVD